LVACGNAVVTQGHRGEADIPGALRGAVGGCARDVHRSSALAGIVSDSLVRETGSEAVADARNEFVGEAIRVLWMG
jgi:hypothetical protein